MGVNNFLPLTRRGRGGFIEDLRYLETFFLYTPFSPEMLKELNPWLHSDIGVRYCFQLISVTLAPKSLITVISLDSEIPAFARDACLSPTKSRFPLSWLNTLAGTSCVGYK